MNVYNSSTKIGIAGRYEILLKMAMSRVDARMSIG